MEDQGKRLLLAVVIAFGLLWAWNMFFPTEAPKQEDEKPAPEKVEKKERSDDERSAERPEGGSTPTERQPEEIVTFDLGHVRAELSTHGAALKSWKLLDPQLEDRDVEPPVPLDLVPTAKRGAEFYPFQVWLGEGELEAMRTGSWELVSKDERSATFRWENDDLELLKKFRIDGDLFFLEMELEVVKKRAGHTEHEPSFAVFGFQDLEADVGGGYTEQPREWKAACLVGDEVKTRSAKQLLEEPARRDGDIKWGGFAHSYFVAIAAPEADSGSRLECDSYGIEEYPGAMRVELSYPEVVLEEPDTGYQRTVVAYYGPKRMSALQAASHQAGFAPEFEEVVDFGFLGFLSGPLLWLLTLFQGLVVNWGLAIICLTVVVKLLVLPWTHKSIKSMKAMSKLRPQMEKIKEKYEDDKQRQQVEMMNLFKSHGVNPLAGCLPMLLQMPIWFALYRMLMVAAELYQAPFIPGWVDDLTAPDPYYVLPVLVTGMMFFQTRLTPTTATGTQQKILMYGMPLMFGFFSLFFPAGLTLYIFTNTCLTLVHHFFVHREDRIKAKAEKLNGKANGDEGDSAPAKESSEERDGAAKGAKPAAKSGSGKGSASKPRAAATKKRKSGGGGSGGKGSGKSRGKKGKKKSGRK